MSRWVRSWVNFKSQLLQVNKIKALQTGSSPLLVPLSDSSMVSVFLSILLKTYQDCNYY